MRPFYTTAPENHPTQQQPKINSSANRKDREICVGDEKNVELVKEGVGRAEESGPCGGLV